MGHIYAIAGPSGVGKTTFLNSLFATKPTNLRLLNRTTSRNRRSKEKEGVDYYYLPQKDFLLKIFANDFVHIEEYENNYYGIEAETIKETINSKEDGIIMAGVFGASKLKAVYGANVSIIFMHSGLKESLRDSRSLTEDFEPTIELKRRLNLKIQERIFNTEEYEQSTIHNFILRRMELNYLEIAFVNGRIRSHEQIYVLENLKDKMKNSVAQFNSIRKTNKTHSKHPIREEEIEINRIKEIAFSEKQIIIGERDRVIAIQTNLKNYVIAGNVTAHMRRRKVSAYFALIAAVSLLGIIYFSLFFVNAEWNWVSKYLVHILTEWSDSKQDITKELFNIWLIHILTASISFLCFTIVWKRLLSKNSIQEAENKLKGKYIKEIEKLERVSL